MRAGVERARKMIDMSDRLDMLERRLALGSSHRGQGQGVEDGDGHVDWLDGDMEDENEDGDGDSADGENIARLVGGNSPKHLTSLALQYRQIERLGDAVGRDHPFVVKLEERLTRCKNTILLDLNTALNQARKSQGGGGQIIQYLGVYTLLDAYGQAVKNLKGG